MNDEQPPHANPDQADPIIPMTSTSEYVEEANAYQKEATTRQDPCSYKDHPPINVYVNQDSKDKLFTWPNRIQIAAVLLNGAMLLVTYLLFLKTQETVDIANKTLSDSRNQDSINHRHDMLRDSIDVIRYETNRIKDSLTIDLASRSLGAQVGSIKETQRQFEKQNDPHLQIIGDPQIEFSNNSKRVSVRYKITNLTNSPANVIDKVVWWNLQPFDPPYNPTRAGNEVYLPMKGSIIKESYIETKGEFPKELTPVENYQLRENHISLYYFTEIRYKSGITGKNRAYKCGIKLSLLKNGQTYSKFLYNENVDEN